MGRSESTQVGDAEGIVRELGEEATTRVRRLVEHDKWRKKRDEWDAWGEEEEIDSTSDGGWEMVRRTRRHESFAESYYQLPPPRADVAKDKV